MTIYENNAVLATIEDCEKNDKAGCNALFKDVVYELRNIDLDSYEQKAEIIRLRDEG